FVAGNTHDAFVERTVGPAAFAGVNAGKIGIIVGIGSPRGLHVRSQRGDQDCAGNDDGGPHASSTRHRLHSRVRRSALRARSATRVPVSTSAGSSSMRTVVLRTHHVLIAVLALKGVFLAADATVRLYLGDSIAYLAGAQSNQWLPRDRSFVYSLFIRAALGPGDPLPALLIWQALAGLATALMLWFALRYRFATPPALAGAAA